MHMKYGVIHLRHLRKFHSFDSRFPTCFLFSKVVVSFPHTCIVIIIEFDTPLLYDMYACSIIY